MLHNNDNLTLAKYRMEKAKSCLRASKLLLNDNFYADSANRSYYAIFNSINALFALEGVGYKKHSGVLSHFNQDYIKTEKIPVKYAKIAKSAFQIRTKSDYSDFYIVSKEEVTLQYNNAVDFVLYVDTYINNLNM